VILPNYQSTIACQKASRAARVCGPEAEGPS
jgi:hypothetical protein